MSIIKVRKRENPFVQIDSSIFKDTNLSWKAKGVLAYLLSKPADWEIRVTDIINQSTDGRDSVYAALRELRQHGYLIKAPIRNEEGKIKEWIEELYEIPNDKARELYAKQQASRKKSKKRVVKEMSDEISVDKSVESFVDNMQPKPLTENTEMDNLAQKPFTENPHTDKPYMDKPNTENPEILIIKNITNIDTTNIDYSKKEDGTEPPINSSQAIIEKFYKLMQQDLSDVSFNTWIKPLEIHIANKSTMLEALNNFIYTIVRDKYLDIIKEKFNELGINKVILKEKSLV